MFLLTGVHMAGTYMLCPWPLCQRAPFWGVISKYPPIPPWRLASPERGFRLETFSGLQGIFRRTAKESVCVS